MALLRGINVGGRHKLPMAKLGAAFVAAGCGDVTTYIQSGNVVFTPPPSGSVAGAGLVAHLERAVEEAAGFAVAVVVRTAADLRAVLATQPFDEDDPTKLHVCFLGSLPTAEALAAFGRAAAASEEFALIGLDLYLHLPAGLGRSKLATALDRLKVPVTARNWRTVTKLHDLACS